MKKIVVLFLLFLSLSFVSAANSSNTMALKEEFLYNGYNNSGKYSTSFNEYNVNSISSNTLIENKICIVPGKRVGISVITGIGYQQDIYCYNRFASIPSNIDGKALFGVVYYPVEGLGVSLAGGLRASYLLNRSNWISQVGGELSIGYSFDFGLSCNVSAAYWYNTNYRSILCGIGLGYSFGGKR